MMRFEIITPDRTALSEEVESVYLPGSLGEMGVLTEHTALITTIEPGELRYKPVGKPEVHIVVGSGFVQIEDNHILMVTDLALEPDEIDESSVEKAIAAAQEALKLAEGMNREDQARFEASLAKQIAVLSFKRKKH